MDAQLMEYSEMNTSLDTSDLKVLRGWERIRSNKKDRQTYQLHVAQHEAPHQWSHKKNHRPAAAQMAHRRVRCVIRSHENRFATEGEAAMPRAGTYYDEKPTVSMIWKAPTANLSHAARRSESQFLENFHDPDSSDFEVGDSDSEE